MDTFGSVSLPLLICAVLCCAPLCLDGVQSLCSAVWCVAVLCWTVLRLALLRYASQCSVVPHSGTMRLASIDFRVVAREAGGFILWGLGPGSSEEWCIAMPIPNYS